MALTEVFIFLRYYITTLGISVGMVLIFIYFLL